jgi:glycogen debranching enzyme
MKTQEFRLIFEAKAILEKNSREEFTMPSPKLYPHQWSWDSCFISIGYSRYDQDRAEKEMLSLFEGQWANGMLPHILFRGGKGYFPAAEYWRTELSEFSPGIKTSGITQPPVHALAALHIYKNCSDNKKARSFLKKIFPKIQLFHRYLLTKRDPENTGLATIFHPWESGLDNSLRWDEALARIKVEDLPQYKRVDTEKVSSDQRPTDADYDRYLYLIEVMKKNNYDEEEIYKAIPFKIKDITFNSILYAANKAMLEMANTLGEDSEEIDSWVKRTKDNYFEYFSPDEPEKTLLYDYDLVGEKRIEKRTAASLISLCTDLLSQKQAKALASWMKHSHMCKEDCAHDHPVITSISVDDMQFNPLNYWRGPVWININWMLYQGMKKHRLFEDAKNLKESIIDLITEHGFYEYYNPLSGEGLGADNFSWTAALLIDLISEKED